LFPINFQIINTNLSLWCFILGANRIFNLVQYIASLVGFFENGTITQIETNLPKCEEEIDLGGKLVLPPYVDPHLHLDYVNI